MTLQQQGFKLEEMLDEEIKKLMDIPITLL